MACARSHPPREGRLSVARAPVAARRRPPRHPRFRRGMSRRSVCRYGSDLSTTGIGLVLLPTGLASVVGGVVGPAGPDRPGPSGLRRRRGAGRVNGSASSSTRSSSRSWNVVVLSIRVLGHGSLSAPASGRPSGRDLRAAGEPLESLPASGRTWPAAPVLADRHSGREAGLHIEDRIRRLKKMVLWEGGLHSPSVPPRAAQMMRRAGVLAFGRHATSGCGHPHSLRPPARSRWPS